MPKKLTEEQKEEATTTPSEAILGKRVISPLQILAAVVIVVVVAGVASGAALVMAAQQLGQATVFGKLGALLPVENLPGVRRFVKPPSVLVRDGLVKSSSLAFYKQLGGLDYAFNFGLNLEGVANELPFTARFGMKELISMSSDLKQSKAVMSMGGKAEAGAIGFDPGEEAVKLEILQPSYTDFYLKFNLSSQMKNTLKSLTAKTSQRGVTLASQTEDNVDSYLDKYLRVNFDEYMKLITEQLPATASTELRPIDPQKISAAYMKLYEQLQPDLMQRFSTTVGDMNRYGVVSYQSRAQLGKTQVIWVKADMDSAKFADVSWELMSSFPEMLAAHRQELLEYCQATTVFKAAEENCQKTFGEKEFTKTIDDIKYHPKITDRIRDKYKLIMTRVHFDQVRFAVSPRDNSIVKFELSMSLDEAAFRHIAEGFDFPPSKIDAIPLKRLGITVSGEEQQRGTGFSVKTPADSINLVEKLKNIIEEQKKQMKQFQKQTKPVKIVK